MVSRFARAQSTVSSRFGANRSQVAALDELTEIGIEDALDIFGIANNDNIAMCVWGNTRAELVGFHPTW